MKGPFKFFALFSLALPLALCSCGNVSSSPSTYVAPTYVAPTDNVAAKYSVTFDTDGGTDIQPQTVESGKTAVRPDDPEKDGFIFCGWYKSDLSGAFDFEKPVTSNVTVKAKWEKKLPEGYYLVIFDTDGGTPVPPHQNIRSGDRATRPAADPAKESFSFCGWYKSDLSEEFDFDESITQDTRVRAKWSGPRRVVFHANGGEGIMADQTIFPCASAALNENAFTRVDHKFLGWAESADGEKIYDDKGVITMRLGEDPFDLYAVWEVKFRENSSMAVTGDIAVRRPDETVRYAPVSAWPDTEYPGYSDYEPLGVCVKNAASDKPFMISLTQETLTWTAAKNKHPADNWSVISQDNAQDVYANKEALNESLNKIGATPLDSGSYWVGENKVCSFNDGSVTDQLTGEALVRTVRPLKNIGKIVFEKSEVRKAAGAGAFVNALSNNGDGVVTYSSSDTGVARVDVATGQVTIVSEGTATITATVAESDAWAYAEKTASYTLKVEKYAGSISYAEETVSKLPNADSFTNELSKTGDGAVTYSSTDESVATVDAATGQVTIVSEGTAVITATVTDSETYAYAAKTASYTLKVEKYAGIISYSTTKVGKTPTAGSFKNNLSNNGDGAVTYSSSDTGVATVDAATGQVTIVSEGTATITATVTDSQTYAYAAKTASYTLVVRQLTFRASKSEVVAGDIAVNGGKYVPAEEWEEYLYSPNGYGAKGVCVDSSFMVKAPTSMGTEMIICARAIDILWKPDVYKFQLPTIEQFGKINEKLSAINSSLGKISGARVIDMYFHWSREGELQESTPKPSLKIYRFGNSSGQAIDVSPGNTTYKGYWYIHVEDLN